jgi:two-component system sensor histidine kinase DesK
VIARGVPASPADDEWLAAHRPWAGGWRRRLLGVLPMLYLLYVVGAVHQYSHGAAAMAGYILLVLFAAGWLLTSLTMLTLSPVRFWSLYGLLLALFAAELPFARGPGFTLCTFLTIITVARLQARSAPVIAAFAVSALLVPVAVPSWHVSLAESFGMVNPVAIPVVGLVIFAAIQVLRSNQALTRARSEVALLAAENERIRIARDLHDLLGHSLTTITVKAGLARRIGETDPVLAVREIAEVETLARQALGDVRAAVSSYRDVTLTAELASGRELLRAAGIAAELPRAVDMVDPAHRELFGWVVREGLTNVVRHAHASSCAIRLSPCSVEIVDDGVGRAARPGNGLAGLRERVTAAGGVVTAGPLQPHGWRLQVCLSPSASTP